MGQHEEENHRYLKNKVVILNGFSNEEISSIMKAVKGLYTPPADLIFAKTTPSSLKMVLKDLIRDMSEDHEYLKQNPPQVKKVQPEDPSNPVQKS